MSKIASAAVRYNVSNRAAAAIGTATLAAAKDGNLLKDGVKDKNILTVDHMKIWRAKDKIMADAKETCHRTLVEDKVAGILFDGRKDVTKVMSKDDAGKYHPSETKEEHYSICDALSGNYITHLTVGASKRNPSMKAADHLATLMFEWLCENQLDERIQAIGGDSTNVNTGYKGGAIALLEQKLGRKLIWLICALHTNELPLRHLLIDLDGPTVSDNKFSGAIGKSIHQVMDMQILTDVPDIGVPIQLIDLEDKILRDLSTDQRYMHRIVSAIKARKVPADLQNTKIGPHNHARWLNLANRLCRMWCCKHNFDEDNTHKLKKLVQFVVGVYALMWFMIKRDWKWFHGPSHILLQLKLLKEMDDGIVDIVTPHVMSSAWNAHPEAVLQAMLCSDRLPEREFAVSKILQLRNGAEKGNASARTFRVPPINMEAKELEDLINWKDPNLTIHEPLLTCDFSKEELLRVVDTPMTVPKFPVHGQSIERCVQAVTRASSSVFGHDRRDGFIKSTLLHRQLMATNRTKQDLMVLFD